MGWLLRRSERFWDMSGSGFIGFRPTEWLEYAEPEVLKYLYLKTPPKRRIILGLDKIPSYIGDYDRAQRIYFEKEPFEDSAELHAIQRSYEITHYNNVPEYRGFQMDYQHAIILSQLVPPDQEGTQQAIQRLQATEILTGKLTKEITDHIQIRLILGRNWVTSNYAPDYLRIELKKQMWNKMQLFLAYQNIKVITEDNYYSKYGLNHARSSSKIGVSLPFGRDFHSTCTLLNKQRNDKNYSLLSLTASKSFSSLFSMEISLNNILNTEYEDIPGVAQPGRAIYLGLTFRHFHGR